MKIETFISSLRNLSGHYFGQIDYNDNQVHVFSSSKAETKRLVKEISKIIKPNKDEQH